MFSAPIGRRIFYVAITAALCGTHICVPYKPPVAVSRYREHFTPNLSSMTFLMTSTQLSSPIAALSKQRS